VPVRAVVRTADGTSVWEGPAAAPADRANGGGAIIEIPADRLRVDDYVIVLFATGPGGEVEQARCVLRVRVR